MRTYGSFHTEYRDLEKRMRVLAESDGDVFLPNITPEGPVEYVLICMEPSLGRWACSGDDARLKVKAGFRNFLFSIDDFILHFCTRCYLCKPAERYHITDLSKGAMLVKRAVKARVERYARWYPLLLEEINLVASPNAGIVTVGRVVSRHLEQQHFPRSFAQVIHYSGQAGSARNAGIEGREDCFSSFKESVSLGDLVGTAEIILKESDLSTDIYDDTIGRLMRSELTVSRKKLIFNYKIAFESMRS